MYNFADSSVTASAFTSGANTALTLVATTAGLTTTAALVIYFDDQATSSTVTGTVELGPTSLNALESITVTMGQVTVTGGLTDVQLRASAVTIGGTVTVGNSVTISSLPAISGTVTANAGDGFPAVIYSGILQYIDSEGAIPVTIGSALPAGTNRIGVVTIGAGTVTIGAGASQIGSVTASISNFPATQAVSLTTLPALVAGTAQIGSVTASISGTVPVSGTFFQATQPASLASLPALAAGTNQIGSVTASISNSVTIASFVTSVTARLINPAGTAVTYAEVGTAGSPSIDVLSVQGVSGGTSLLIGGTTGSFTTRFGSVTTANTAQISTAVTNSSRKYLFVQNVTTSSNVITVGIGFTPTTTQGIQLAAGALIDFESSFIPTGAVYILSSVTGSPFTILEA
jgi:hypothetical protein